MNGGAVAYLTNSKYGRCTNGSCTEVTINNCSNYMTGIGTDSVSEKGSSSTTCTTSLNKYNGTKGVLASTTGNITGVYDMNGAAWEYTMGNMSNASNSYSFNSSAAELSSWYTDDTSKYVVTYAYNTSSTSYNKGRLGDATGEVAVSASENNCWYNDGAFFPYTNWGGSNNNP